MAGKYRSIARKVVVAPPAPKVDLSALTKADLVNLASSKGVSTTGTKAELVERLNG